MISKVLNAKFQDSEVPPADLHEWVQAIICCRHSLLLYLWQMIWMRPKVEEGGPVYCQFSPRRRMVQVGRHDLKWLLILWFVIWNIFIANSPTSSKVKEDLLSVFFQRNCDKGQVSSHGWQVDFSTFSVLLMSSSIWTQGSNQGVCSICGLWQHLVGGRDQVETGILHEWLAHPGFLPMMCVS